VSTGVRPDPGRPMTRFASGPRMPVASVHAQHSRSCHLAVTLASTR
jgi:hypothetical protein